jgi:hypothetical protein
METVLVQTLPEFEVVIHHVPGTQFTSDTQGEPHPAFPPAVPIVVVCGLVEVIDVVDPLVVGEMVETVVAGGSVLLADVDKKVFAQLVDAVV